MKQTLSIVQLFFYYENVQLFDSLLIVWI